MTDTPLVSTRPEWAALREHAAAMSPVHLRDLFDRAEDRGRRYTLEAAGLYLDYSKHRVDDTTLGLLVDLAHAVDLEGARERMLAGERINATEGRAVLHTALRAPRDAVVEVDGTNVVPAVHEVLDAMSGFADQVRVGQGWRGGGGGLDAPGLGVGMLLLLALLDAQAERLGEGETLRKRG